MQLLYKSLCNGWLRRSYHECLVGRGHPPTRWEVPSTQLLGVTFFLYKFPLSSRLHES